MRIGIDISQLAYGNTGVGNYLRNLIKNLIELDSENEYVLFFSSLRRTFKPSFLNLKSIPKNVEIKQFKMPPSALDFFWNKLHVFSVESLIGNVDLFITSDWTEPPVKRARKATIVYDLIVYKHPKETHKTIVETQKRKLNWVKKESDLVITISQSSKKDIEKILGIDDKKIKVIYPGL